MGIALGLLLLVAPLVEAPHRVELPPGTWPAGTLLLITEELTGRAIYPEAPRIGNRPVVLDRALPLGRAAVPAIVSLLLDAGVALLDLEPGSPDRGWIASARTAGIRRPIAIEVQILRPAHQDPDELARILNERASAQEKDLPPGDVPTRFIPDPRTGAVIARYASGRSLETYLELLARLDRPDAAPEGSPVLRTYLPRHRAARDLEPLFAARWQQRGGFQIRVVVPRGRNVLIIRCPPQVWAEAEQLLRELDQPL